MSLLLGVNDQGPNAATLHTSPGCTQPATRAQTGYADLRTVEASMLTLSTAAPPSTPIATPLSTEMPDAVSDPTRRIRMAQPLTLTAVDG